MSAKFGVLGDSLRIPSDTVAWGRGLSGQRSNTYKAPEFRINSLDPAAEDT